MKKGICIYVLIFLSILSYAQRHDTCIYDSSKISDEFINRINSEKYVWNNKTKEAKIITKEGDFLYIKKWACVTEGVLARLVIFTTTNTDSLCQSFLQWKQKIFELGDEILDAKSKTSFDNYFNDSDLTAGRVGKDLVFYVSDEGYKKFVVVVSPQDQMVVISLVQFK